MQATGGRLGNREMDDIVDRKGIILRDSMCVGNVIRPEAIAKNILLLLPMSSLCNVRTDEK